MSFRVVWVQCDRFIAVSHRVSQFIQINIRCCTIVSNDWFEVIMFGVQFQTFVVHCYCFFVFPLLEILIGFIFGAFQLLNLSDEFLSSYVVGIIFQNFFQKVSGSLVFIEEIGNQSAIVIELQIVVLKSPLSVLSERQGCFKPLVVYETLNFLK